MVSLPGLWWCFGCFSFSSLGEWAGVRDSDAVANMNMSKPKLGLWNAFTKIFDIKGAVAQCSLPNIAWEPLDHMTFEVGHAASLCRNGLYLGGYALLVAQLGPLLARAMEDTLIWSIPRLSCDDGWHIGHLFSGGFAGWSQAATSIDHNVEQVNIGSQVTVELDTRTSYAWGATFGRELHAAPLDTNCLTLPGGKLKVVKRKQTKMFAAWKKRSDGVGGISNAWALWYLWLRP